jgi:hypothetical protein
MRRVGMLSCSWCSRWRRHCRGFGCVVCGLGNGAFGGLDEVCRDALEAYL